MCWRKTCKRVWIRARPTVTPDASASSQDLRIRCPPRENGLLLSPRVRYLLDLHLRHVTDLPHSPPGRRRTLLLAPEGDPPSTVLTSLRALSGGGSGFARKIKRKLDRSRGVGCSPGLKSSPLWDSAFNALCGTIRPLYPNSVTQPFDAIIEPTARVGERRQQGNDGGDDLQRAHHINALMRRASSFVAHPHLSILTSPHDGLFQLSFPTQPHALERPSKISLRSSFDLGR